MLSQDRTSISTAEHLSTTGSVVIEPDMHCSSTAAQLFVLAALTTILLQHHNLELAASEDGLRQNNSTTIPSSDEPLDFYAPSSCTWSPSAPEECQAALMSRLCRNQPTNRASRRRFLVMGDSTAGPDHLFKYLYNFTVQDAQAQIQAAYGNEYIAEIRRGGRCRNNELFGLDYPSDWIGPNYTLGEGPVQYGAKVAFCSDCLGCHSIFLVVSRNASASHSSSEPSLKGPLLYGGFIKSEFARDVEIQSPQFRTTQENTAYFIQNAYNTPDLLEEWPDMPICLLSSAHHDAAIAGITQDRYLSNVEWFIKVMQPQCHFIIWLGANLPAGQVGYHKYPQTPELTTSWNRAVRQLLDSRPDLNAMFVDVLNASHHEGNLTKGNNVHMNPIWYETLADFFTHVLTTEC